MTDRALLDTNVVAYWLGGHPDFKHSLGQMFGSLKRKKATLLVSSVTVQELEVWARLENSVERVRDFLAARFGEPLSLDKASAREAARLAAAVGRPKGTTGGETKALVNQWHRDASIAGIAQHHGLSLLVTANRKDFEPFVEHVNWELVPVVQA